MPRKVQKCNVHPYRSGDPEQLAAVKDRFPRGGAMGLLDRSHSPPAQFFSSLLLILLLKVTHKFAAILSFLNVTRV